MFLLTVYFSVVPFCYHEYYCEQLTRHGGSCLLSVRLCLHISKTFFFLISCSQIASMVMFTALFKSLFHSVLEGDC